MGHTIHMSQSLADVDELLAANTTRVTKLFASLKSGTGDDEAALPVGEGTTYDDIWALRFCLSHEDDAEALSHARRTLAWRKEHAEMLELAGKGEKVKKFASIEKFVAADYHGEDKRGNPVYCIRAGVSNPPAMMDANTKDEVLAFMMYRKELGFRICDEKTRKTRKLHKLITVNDLNHVSLMAGTEKRFQKVLGESSKLSETLYPQLLDRAVLVNVPYIFSVIWSMVRGLISAKTRAKVAICPGDTLKGDVSKCPFAKMINMETIPTFMGGSCRCRPGCICGVPNDQKTMVARTDGEGLISANVAARDKLQAYVEVNRGDKVAWYLQVTERGVEIDVVLRENGINKGTPMTVVKRFKHKAGAGVKSEVLESPGSGTLVFTFSNEYSYFNSKNIKYKCENITAVARENTEDGEEDGEDGEAEAVVKKMANLSATLTDETDGDTS